MKIDYEEDYCVLCLSDSADPNREDGLCAECAKISDSYNEDNLNLESEE
jgi:hypothetical protein